MTPRDDTAEPTGAMTSRPLDTAAMRALAHPLRISLFDQLSKYGPATASSLGADLGETSGATSYHLRQLARHGLIREAPGRGSARERWWERVPGPVEIGSPETQQTPAGREVGDALTRGSLRGRIADLESYFYGPHEDTGEWSGTGQMSTAFARLTAAQLMELEKRLRETLRAFIDPLRDQDPAGTRPAEIQLYTFPLPEHDSPVNDERTDDETANDETANGDPDGGQTP